MELENADAFSSYIASLWRGKFHHRYTVTRHRSWNRWREVCPRPESDKWFCESLEQAARHYSWAESGNLSFEQLSMMLREAINAGNNDVATTICLEIFRWGGVALGATNSSRKWVMDQSKGFGLCNALSNACRLLCASSETLDLFDGRTLLMNSAMCKIYAACEPTKLVIYDGRVGAALGLLVKDFLVSVQHISTIPKHLAFRWGRSRDNTLVDGKNRRDPSGSGFQFGELFRYNPDVVHAENMRTASRILCRVSQLISEHHPLSEVERALFMIGYDVSRSENRIDFRSY